MEFYELLEQVLDLLRRRGRVSYRALKAQFHLDDDYLAALKDELIDAQRLASDEDGKVLVWTGDTAPTPPALKPEPAHSPTRRHTLRKRFSPGAASWKASASRSRCCLPTSRARRS